MSNRVEFESNRSLISSFSESKVAQPVHRNLSEIFWGLKNNWWMQIFDGRFHKYGLMVFDEGLHGKIKEPGFLASIENACRYASRHLGKLPTVQFYKKVHLIACAHFDGEVTNIKGNEAGRFRRANTCKGDFCTLFPYLSAEEVERVNQSAKVDLRGTGYEYKDPQEQAEIMKKSGYSDEREFLEALQSARAMMLEFHKKVVDQVRQTNAEIVRRCSRLRIEPIAAIALTEFSHPWNLRMCYKCERVENVVQTLFDQFSKSIVNAKSDDEKIMLIADLYQMLEWTHPFPDGQGRTDLVLLSKLLTEHGFNPPILERPYFSTWSTLEEWTAYLKRGIEKWQNERAKSLTP